MTNFTSTPSYALRFFIFSSSITLLVWLVLGFSIWTTVPFFLNNQNTDIVAWVTMSLIWLGILIGAVSFTRTTVANWHAYKRSEELENHISDNASILAGYLITYHMEMKRPQSFTFESFAKWLDTRKSLMAVHEALDFLLQLEAAEQVTIERPATGGLVITLTKKFHQRTMFAIAPNLK